MVTLQDVYDAFLARVTDEDWSDAGCSEEDLEWMVRDWRSFLEQAIPYFKFPRCNLTIDETTQSFTDPAMSQAEVQILSVYMKQAWVNRTIDHWENIKPYYDEKDFSQANLLKTFISLKQSVQEEAQQLEALYYRTPNKKPYRFSRLAGGNRG